MAVSRFLFQFFPFMTFIVLWAAKSLLTPRMRTYKRAAQIRRLLNPPDSPLEDLLFARAIPNQRLAIAFGITSTFVSRDTKVHKAFTTKAKSLVAGAGARTWFGLASCAEATAHRFLPAECDIVAFSTLIQCITFSVVLSTLFHTNLEMICYNDVVHVTDIINQRWTDSKTKDATAMRQDKGSLRSLLAYIGRWVDHDQYPNPLNFILPAYETMWRVVAVTVAHVYHCRDNALHDVVIAFGRDPTEQRFLAFGEDGRQPSMQAIILEVLRLYPPTRHIARASGNQSNRGSWWSHLLGVSATEVADVEGVHLSEDYGENASLFDPMRFHPLRMRERPELFSFGHGRLKCVAAHWAPMAAAVIAATIVVKMEEAGRVVVVGPRIGRRNGWEGWSVGRGA